MQHRKSYLNLVQQKPDSFIGCKTGKWNRY